MMHNNYDLIVIGGGAAGLVASKLARGLGKKVALIEKAQLGGGCTWTGCVPSKTLINIANVVSTAQRAQNYYTKNFESSIDSSKVMESVRTKRNEIYQTHTQDMIKKAGIDLYFGDPKFITASSIEIDGETLYAKKFIIATGSSSFIPPIDGIETINYVTNETFFELKDLPKSMIILGSGPVGIEIACALNQLGVKITLLEMENRILPKEDHEISSLLYEKMKTNGIDVRTSTKLVKVMQKNGVTCICIQSTDNQMDVCAESLFLAVGRIPNIEGLNLEGIGVETTAKGILTSSTLQTSVSNIYACGDVVGPYQFSHMAEYQASIAAQNALIPFYKKHINYDNVIWTTFSNPELASAGLTESEARKKFGNKLKIFTLPYSNIDRAKIDDNAFGLCKIICDSKGYIVGAHILGANAGELIHELQIGKYYHFRIWDFYKPIHAYPTYSELIWHCAKKAYIQKLQNNFLLKIAKKIFSRSH